MGRTYSVPRNVKGETRLLYIFSIKSLAFTIGFGLVGILVYFIFSAVNLKIFGLIMVVLFALIGFGVGSLVIPDSPLVGNLRKAGGEAVSDILFRMVTFKKRKRIYLYRGGKK